MYPLHSNMQQAPPISQKGSPILITQRPSPQGRVQMTPQGLNSSPHTSNVLRSAGGSDNSISSLPRQPEPNKQCNRVIAPYNISVSEIRPRENHFMQGNQQQIVYANTQAQNWKPQGSRSLEMRKDVDPSFSYNPIHQIQGQNQASNLLKFEDRNQFQQIQQQNPQNGSFQLHYIRPQSLSPPQINSQTQTYYNGNQNQTIQVYQQPQAFNGRCQSDSPFSRSQQSNIQISYSNQQYEKQQQLPIQQSQLQNQLQLPENQNIKRQEIVKQFQYLSPQLPQQQPQLQSLSSQQLHQMYYQQSQPSVQSYSPSNCYSPQQVKQYSPNKEDKFRYQTNVSPPFENRGSPPHLRSFNQNCPSSLSINSQINCYESPSSPPQTAPQVQCSVSPFQLNNNNFIQQRSQIPLQPQKQVMMTGYVNTVTPYSSPNTGKATPSFVNHVQVENSQISKQNQKITLLQSNSPSSPPKRQQNSQAVPPQPPPPIKSIKWSSSKPRKSQIQQLVPTLDYSTSINSDQFQIESLSKFEFEDTIQKDEDIHQYLSKKEEEEQILKNSFKNKKQEIQTAHFLQNSQVQVVTNSVESQRIQQKYSIGQPHLLHKDSSTCYNAQTPPSFKEISSHTKISKALAIEQSQKMNLLLQNNMDLFNQKSHYPYQFSQHPNGETNLNEQIHSAASNQKQSNRKQYYDQNSPQSKIPEGNKQIEAIQQQFPLLLRKMNNQIIEKNQENDNQENFLKKSNPFEYQFKTSERNLPTFNILDEASKRITVHKDFHINIPVTLDTIREEDSSRIGTIPNLQDPPKYQQQKNQFQFEVEQQLPTSQQKVKILNIQPIPIQPQDNKSQRRTTFGMETNSIPISHNQYEN